ncbi:MAG: DUF4440 domain-containing protein [Gammaproteobacteria bacterium]
MKLSMAKLKSIIHSLEERLLERQTRLDPNALNSLLAADFIEFGANGMAWNRAQIIDALQSQAFVRRQISAFEIRVLADEVVLATYTCTIHGPDSSSESLRSSIWRRQGQQWQMAFHQGTAKAG